MKKILSSTWFLALIPALIVFIFLSSVGSRYSITVENAGDYYGLVKYEDIDSDNISETISSDKGIPYYYLVILDNDFRVLDQWNLPDSLNPMISNFAFGNYDHDRFKEIYIFTHSGDSLFLNVNEIRDKEGLKLERKFITKVSYIKGELTTNAYAAGFFDENMDGMDEFYFILATGFGLQPRKAYYYDIAKNELKSSQFAAMICYEPKFTDSDGDEKPEIFGWMSASGNYHTRVPYSDSSTWLMVFNEKLEFEFPPVEFPGFTNRLLINSYTNSGFRGYVLSHSTGAADSTILKPRIMLFSSDGKLIRYRLYNEFGFKINPDLCIINHKDQDRIYLLGDDFFELNSEFEIEKRVKSPFKATFASYQEDIDDNGEEELILYSRDEEKLVVFGPGLRKYAELKLKTTESKLAISHNWSVDHKHNLFAISGGNSFFIGMKKNHFYYAGYLAYPGIYLLLYLFIFVIKRITTVQIEQKERMKQRLLTLQLQGIKSQFDPHFTFNALNSVASLVYMDDRKAAYDYLNKFTQLIRRLLNDAERIYRSLNEELEFVTTYLDLEKLRFGDKFNYEIVFGDGVTGNEQVPKLVLQTFAENAIKHGIMPREEGGILKISVKKESEYLILTVEDNGVGRAEAAGHSTSTGKGLKLTDEFYEILNKVLKKPLKFLITDLYDNTGSPAGTRVEVRVPADLLNP